MTSVAANNNPKGDDTKIPVSFLLSLTDPDADSMVAAFMDEPGRDDDAPPVDLQPDLQSAHLTPSPPSRKST
ncbi:hypothetical protein N0V88_007665 [Collariella sp. IMI 366227]|nr:hypothetical protein N0V88_007665 [Collariella sp. IMI 366227]